MDGSNLEILLTEIATAECIAVDWVAHNMYWTESSNYVTYFTYFKLLLVFDAYLITF